MKPGVPKFRYSCRSRMKILKKLLTQNDYEAMHEVDDFVIESIEIENDREIWYLGS